VRKGRSLRTRNTAGCVDKSVKKLSFGKNRDLFQRIGLALLTIALTTAVTHVAEAQQEFSIPPDSLRWKLEGETKPAEYRGRKSLLLNGGAATLKNPGFLGIVSRENDAIYIPLKKGRNELLLAVSELGGGWGFICRLADGLKLSSLPRTKAL
jgi:hypothetical protein